MKRGERKKNIYNEVLDKENKSKKENARLNIKKERTR
jgi:hypothetical protein